ncbi:MAG: citrate synthase family protein [Desulfobulbaceae bacterium]
MVDTSFWDQRRGKIYSRKGGWIIGEAIYNHGYSMMDDLVGKASSMQVLVLNVTGRLPERRLADWFEAAFICMSWPDARIWCNQIGSLAGTMQASSVVGVTAGILATDSTLYGAAPLLKGTKFIRESLVKKKIGLSVEEILKEHQRHPDSVPMIVGYARPIATGDERVDALRRVAEQLGFETGEHLSLACEIEQVLLEKFNEGMNINGYISAFLCDQGYSNMEIYRIGSTCVSSGVQACYTEAADQVPESFFPLQCNDIDYQGPPPRTVPDKK